MSLIAYLIVLAFSGIIVGGLARLVVPGPDPMTIPQTIILGLAGSFAAGLIARLVFNAYGAGIVLSVACSALIVLIVRRVRGGWLDDGGPRARLRR